MLENLNTWDGISIAISLIDISIFFYIVSKLEKPSKDKKTVIAISLFYIVFFGILPVDFDLWLGFVVQIILMSIYILLCYKTSIKRALFVSASYTVFEILVFLAVMGVYAGFLGEAAIENLGGYNAYTLHISFIVLTVMVFVASLVKLKDRFEKLEIDIDSYQILFIPIMMNFIIISIVSAFILGLDEYNYNMFIFIFVFYMLTVLSNIYVINKLIGIIKKGIKSDYDNKIILEKMDSQYKYYNSVKESNERAKKIYHDINNHLMCIKNLEDSEQEEYIDELYKSIEENSKSPQTGNMILDVIISEKRSACRKKGINFKCDIDFSRGEFMDMMDVCSIFSNILDNAIEACDKIEEKRYINIKGKNVGNYIVLKCINSKSNDIKIDSNGKIETDKSDKDNHGLGMESIRKSVEKYDGNMEIYYDEKEFKVVVYIPIDS